MKANVKISATKRLRIALVRLYHRTEGRIGGETEYIRAYVGLGLNF